MQLSWNVKKECEFLLRAIYLTAMIYVESGYGCKNTLFFVRACEMFARVYAHTYTIAEWNDR